MRDMINVDQQRATSAEKETGRLEAFSDGVIAIVITLLVFNIGIPPADEVGPGGLLNEVVGLWPNLISFAASFFFILVMWINHHRLFTVIRRIDNNLLLLNGLLLFGITVVPVPTALVAEYLTHPERTTAVIIYNGWMLIVAIFFNLLWWYAAKDNRLFTEKTDMRLVRHISRQYSFGPVLYLVTLLLSLVNPFISLAGTIALAIFFALPNRDVQNLLDQSYSA